jgi:signal transduction histidine kinase
VAILQLLDRQTERLNRLVNDLLEASQIGAGRLALHPEPVDLKEIAREMVRLHATDSSLHTISLKSCDQPVVIHGDRQRLERVLDNLISNAIKYSPEGGPVDVAVLRDEEEAVVSVTDRGIGIAADEQELIFEPFRRVGAIKDHVPGVGIGLSVVQRIVAAHHGRVEVESSPGRGATFRVRLPVRPERAPSRANEWSGVPPSSAPALGTLPVPHFLPALVVRF